MKKKLLFFLTTLLIIDGVFFVFGLYQHKLGPFQKQEMSELSEVNFQSLSFSELETYFRALAEKKGGEYAYEVLKKAPTKEGIDMHLLGHVVGEVLYKQKGFDAIAVCTEDFRNACSHTVVVGLFTDFGTDALPKIAEACRRAPGSGYAYPLCYHGLGHGILASVGYDLPKAVELCKKTGKRLSGPEFPECVGGAVMEIDSGGFHDREIWLKESKRYLRPQDPLYPCNASFIPKEAKKLCYIYLTPHLLRLAGNKRGTPTSPQIVEAFRYCDAFVTGDPNRYICFGAFGKDFVVFAKNRDIRKISEITEEELKQVYTWCALAKDKKGEQACHRYAVSSLYWGGTNGYESPTRFCKIMEDRKDQSACFSNLIGFVLKGNWNIDKKSEFCAQLTHTYQYDCQERIRKE